MTDRTPTGTRQDTDGDTDRPALSVSEAADRLGLTPDAVRARLHRGTLDGEKHAGAWRVWLSTTTTDRQTTVDRQDPTGHRQDAPTAEVEALRDHVAHLAADVAYLQDQLAQRSRELATERERSDVIQQLALQRIPVLTPGESPAQTAPQTVPAAPGGPSPAEAGDRASATTVGAWWRRLLGRP